MDFTREPIVETIITPKGGHKLLIRNSKGSNFEDFQVDAVEVVSFGACCFFRSIERPQAFLVPLSDYEIIEVRETRLVLKGVNERGNKSTLKESKPAREKEVEPYVDEESEHAESSSSSHNPAPAPESETRFERKHKRQRKRRGREERDSSKEANSQGEHENASHKKEEAREQEDSFREDTQEPISFSTREEPKVPRERFLLPPPPTLISETIAKYKDIPVFAGAFYQKEEKLAELEQKVFEDDRVYADQDLHPSTQSLFSAPPEEISDSLESSPFLGESDFSDEEPS